VIPIHTPARHRIPICSDIGRGFGLAVLTSKTADEAPRGPAVAEVASANGTLVPARNHTVTPDR